MYKKENEVIDKLLENKTESINLLKKRKKTVFLIALLFAFITWFLGYKSYETLQGYEESMLGKLLAYTTGSLITSSISLGLFFVVYYSSRIIKKLQEK